MSLVWRKIQRSNKKAAKFRFSAIFQELSVHCTNKWQPAKLCVSWVHRRRRYSTTPLRWEPTITDPYKGLIIWPASAPNSGENGSGGGGAQKGAPGRLDIETTMYRDSRNESFDDKEWTFIVEEVTNSGKHKPVAGINLNMRLFVQEPGVQTELKLKLKPLRDNLQDCRLQLVLSCAALGPEGDAFDEDMRSVASQMSVQNSASVTSPVKNSNTIEEFLGENVLEKFEKLPKNQKIDPKGSKIDIENERDSSGTVDQFAKSTSQEMEKILQSLNDSSLSPQPKNKHSPPQPLHGTPTSQQRQSMLDNQNDTSSDLMTWCKNVTKSYRNVKITDFSTSWRNGLAFCALVHHFRPELFNFDSLDSKNIYQNCSLAFDNAANLGIARIISPADMVILAIPDKIAVMTYVSLLRDLFTNKQQQHQKDGLELIKSRPASFRTSFVNESNSSSAAIAKNLKTTNSEHLTLRLSSENVQKPTLMTRNQLMNPFDSDDDLLIDKLSSTQNQDTKIETATPKSPELSPAAAPQIDKSPSPTKSIVDPILSSSSAVTTRALKLLEQYEKQPLSLTNDDENRKQVLKERARKLIEDAKSGNLPGATAMSCKTVKMSDVINDKPQTVQYNNGDRTKNNINNTVKKSAISDGSGANAAMARSLYKKSPWLSYDERSHIVSTPPEQQMSTSFTFEQFKRFGSMRGQELANNVNLLSERISRTIRSQSIPQNLVVTESTISTPNNDSPIKPLISPLASSPINNFDPSSTTNTKSSTSILSRDKIARELELVQSKQKELDKKATLVERRWRQIMQTATGSEQEQSAMNEYLSLLNERNMLTRQEMHLSLLDNINEHEEKFADVQRQLGDLIKMDDSEKTEAHKIRIDQLMAELINIVNKRDELMQQLMANEQATEDDAELAHDVMTQSTALLSTTSNGTHIDKESCSIQ